MSASRFVSTEQTEDVEHRRGYADAFSLAFTRNAHLNPADRLCVAGKAGERARRAKAGHVALAVAIEARRGPVVLDELQPGREENLREEAKLVAEPIAERHAVTVAAIFSRSRARYITAARAELAAELLARDWPLADVARALGISGPSAFVAARRHRERTQAVAQERSRANGR